MTNRVNSKTLLGKRGQRGSMAGVVLALLMAASVIFLGCTTDTCISGPLHDGHGYAEDVSGN